MNIGEVGRHQHLHLATEEGIMDGSHKPHDATGHFGWRTPYKRPLRELV